MSKHKQKVEEMLDKALGHGEYAHDEGLPVTDLATGEVVRIDPHAPDAPTQAPLPEIRFPDGWSEEKCRRFMEMIVKVPEAGADGEWGILEQIAAAETTQDLDGAWRSDGLSDFVGRPIEIQAIKRHKSEYGGTLGVYLIVELIDEQTAEIKTVTAGSVAVVAQLAKAHVLGGLPLRCILRRAERPTAAGYYPQHLEISK